MHRNRLRRLHRYPFAVRPRHLQLKFLHRLLQQQTRAPSKIRRTAPNPLPISHLRKIHQRRVQPHPRRYQEKPALHLLVPHRRHPQLPQTNLARLAMHQHLRRPQRIPR